jgi:hypothetical protein
VPRHPHESYLIQSSQCRESIQAFCNQPLSHSRAAKRRKCRLAIRKNKDSLMFISPSYIFRCTLKNDTYFDLKTVAVFSGYLFYCRPEHRIRGAYEHSLCSTTYRLLNGPQSGNNSLCHVTIRIPYTGLQ